MCGFMRSTHVLSRILGKPGRWSGADMRTPHVRGELQVPGALLP